MDCDHLLQEEIEHFNMKDEQKNIEPRPNIPEEKKEEYTAKAMNMIYGMDKNGNPITFNKAKEQILRNDLAKAAQLRDEYKMQLDAANKDNKSLREEYNCLWRVIKTANEQLDTANKEIEVYKNKYGKVLLEKWEPVLNYSKFGEPSSYGELKEQLDAANKEIEALKKEAEEYKKLYKLVISDSCHDEEEIEKLCEPIIGREFIAGDSYCVPGVIAVVEETINHLKEELEEQKKINKAWSKEYSHETSVNDQMLKEVLSLRELKKENVELIEAVADLKKVNTFLKENLEVFKEMERLIIEDCKAIIGCELTDKYMLLGVVKNLIKYLNEIKQQRDEYEVKYLEYQRDLNTQEDVNNQLRRQIDSMWEGIEVREKERKQLIEKYEQSWNTIRDLRKQITNAQDTIVGLRNLREENREMDKSFLSDSDRFKLTQHECTVKWLSETEKRLNTALIENNELRQALEVFRDILKKNRNR